MERSVPQWGAAALRQLPGTAAMRHSRVTGD